MKTTTIAIEDNHADWVEQNSINLSDWVRKKISEAMEEKKR